MRLLLLLALLLAGCGPDARYKPFDGKVAEYAALKPGRLPAPGGQEYGQKCYLKPKVVILDKATGKLDESFLELPDNLRATQPSEVQSVVWVEWVEEFAGGGKTGKTKFYRVNGQLTVIDVSGRQPVISFCPEYMGVDAHSLAIQGKAPDIGSGDKVVGAKPTAGVVDYLKSLPPG